MGRCIRYLPKYVLKAIHVRSSTFYTALRLEWQAQLKTVFENIEYEVKSKDCELYLDKFRLEVHRDLDMLLVLDM